MISFALSHPLFTALFLLACAACLVLVAFVAARDYARKRVWYAPPVFVITHVPRSIGLPTAWRRTHESEHWN